MRELAHRRHIKTTVGTTLKGHYRIVQYRIIQYIDCDYIHTTLTLNRRRQDRDREVARSASGRQNCEAAV